MIPVGMSTIGDIILKMRKLDGALAAGEQQVSDFVLDNLRRIAHMKQDEIAAETCVSVATVNRFCKTIGCKGFKDFRIIIAQSVAVNTQYLGGQNDARSPTDQVVLNVFGALVDSLNTARNQINQDDIEAAAERLASAKRIVFFGVGGSSANVAREGVNRFFRLGIPAEAHCDGYFQRMLAATLKEGDVLFVISASGLPPELLDSVAVAHLYGAATISLTKIDSPLAASTQISIKIDLPEDQNIYKPTASRLVVMAIIDVLATLVAQTKPAIASENLRRIRTALIPLSKDAGPKPIGD